MNVRTGQETVQFSLPRALQEELSQLRPWRSYLAIAGIWLSVAALLSVLRWSHGTPYFWAAYLPGAFLIAGRQGALLQMLHESAHHLISSDPTTNRWIGRWLCGYPIGVFFDGYAEGHVRHHVHVGTERDPRSDREKHRRTRLDDPAFYLLFLKDLCGLTALQIFLVYEEDERGRAIQREVPKAKHLFQLLFVQAGFILLLFGGDLAEYLLYWVYPAMGPHMFLMRIRGIAEHGYKRQLSERSLNPPTEQIPHTRSLLSPSLRYRFAPLVWIERILIGSLNVYYHFEHHLRPSIPYYHLPRLHRSLRDQIVATNPHIYAKGYFHAAFGGGLGPSKLRRRLEKDTAIAPTERSRTGSLARLMRRAKPAI